MLTFYEHPLSPYAQKVKIALREKGLPFEAHTPAGLGSGADYDPAFLAASPRGEVPALVDGETRVFDSTIILEYLEDKWPGSPLLPRDPAARARARMIEDVMDTHYEAINWGPIEIRYMGRIEGAMAATLTARAAEQTAAWRRWLNTELGDAPWFGGSQFGLADLSIVPYLNCSAEFGMKPEPGTALADWFERVNARPAVAETAREALEIMPALTGIAPLLAAGAFKREYRDHRLEWIIRSGGMQVVLDGIRKDNIRFFSEFETV